jgi:hypothetical protein
MQETIVRMLGIISVVTVALIMLMLLTACGSKPKVSNQDEQIKQLQRQLQQQIVLGQEQAELLQEILAADAGTQAQLVYVTQALNVVQGNVNSLLLQVAELQDYSNIVEMIDPCGDNINKIDEVLLALSSGEILASFSDNANGLNTRFGLLKAGNYVTTDGTNCHFQVLSNGNVVWN